MNAPGIWEHYIKGGFLYVVADPSEPFTTKQSDLSNEEKTTFFKESEWNVSSSLKSQTI